MNTTSQRLLLALLFVAPVSWSSESRADITTYMEAWDVLPQVQISQGTAYDCGANRIVYDQPMYKGFRRSWPGSGDQGDDICWRRTSDPLDSNSGLTDYWTRCASSSSLLCEIN
jgi:hypothetical protein